MCKSIREPLLEPVSSAEKMEMSEKENARKVQLNVFYDASRSMRRLHGRTPVRSCLFSPGSERSLKYGRLHQCGKTGSMMPLTSSKTASFPLFSRKR
jgi:hypothetical protein